jgi:hypothetical protein
MSIMNSFINNIFERIATEARKLAAYNNKATLSSREIQTPIHRCHMDQDPRHVLKPFRVHTKKGPTN